MPFSLQKHSKSVEKALSVCLWCCAVVMFLIFACGVYDIGKGIFLMFAGHPGHLISAILNGLELIFVSPLIYLLMLSLYKYVNAVQPQPIEHLKEKTKYLNNVMLEITTVKIDRADAYDLYGTAVGF